MSDWVVAAGVREHYDGRDVMIGKDEGRYVVEASADCDYFVVQTRVDLVDLIKYVRTEMPNLLEEE